jgi:hypothetical protein
VRRDAYATLRRVREHHGVRRAPDLALCEAGEAVEAVEAGCRRGSSGKSGVHEDEHDTTLVRVPKGEESVVFHFLSCAAHKRKGYQKTKTSGNPPNKRKKEKKKKTNKKEKEKRKRKKEKEKKKKKKRKRKKE